MLHLTATYRSRDLRCRVRALVLLVLLGSLASVGKAQAQYLFYGDGFGTVAAEVMLAPSAVGALITDLAIVSQLAARKPVSRGWSITGMTFSGPLFLFGGLGLALARPTDGSEAMPLFVSGLAFGAVSLALSGVGLHFAPAPRDSRPPSTNTTVTLSANWEGDEVLLRGSVRPNPSRGAVRIRFEVLGGIEAWLDLAVDAGGRFSVSLPVPAGTREVHAMAWFQGHLKFKPARSSSVRLRRPDPALDEPLTRPNTERAPISLNP